MVKNLPAMQEIWVKEETYRVGKKMMYIIQIFYVNRKHTKVLYVYIYMHTYIYMNI